EVTKRANLSPLMPTWGWTIALGIGKVRSRTTSTSRCKKLFKQNSNVQFFIKCTFTSFCPCTLLLSQNGPDGQKQIKFMVKETNCKKCTKEKSPKCNFKPNGVSGREIGAVNERTTENIPIKVFVAVILVCRRHLSALCLSLSFQPALPIRTAFS
uniref:Uncharacterized protein n=1 Tax=Xenopus tropicalis TaxID=8364 RepID=A0A803K677_XENTR